MKNNYKEELKLLYQMAEKYFNETLSERIKLIINKAKFEYKFDNELLEQLFYLSKTKNDKAKYMNIVIDDWNQKNIKTINDYNNKKRENSNGIENNKNTANEDNIIHIKDDMFKKLQLLANNKKISIENYIENLINNI